MQVLSVHQGDGYVRVPLGHVPSRHDDVLLLLEEEKAAKKKDEGKREAILALQPRQRRAHRGLVGSHGGQQEVTNTSKEMASQA